MAGLAGRTVFITGASRGIGRAIALRAARDGANVVVAAKTATPHPKLPGTIHSVAEEVEEAGGRALPLRLDVRDAEAVERAVAQAAERFGGIDAVVNNASAIHLAPVAATPVKRFDLMLAVNARATFCVSRAALPHLLRAENPHILTLCPPLNLKPRWFRDHTPYTVSKYAMSLLTLGLAAELAERGVAVNGLWPRTVIATAALRLLPQVEVARCRRPEIVADAAHWILTRPARAATGRFFVDEEVLAEAGVTDLERYAVEPGRPLLPDLFLDP
ncbi:MAG: NAD(P)-dependent oxidoreductase [Nitrospirae bacterium]|nr:MAG: NAD(P)-dependent oxidoreductase [Nitrospirota bacterium]